MNPLTPGMFAAETTLARPSSPGLMGNLAGLGASLGVRLATPSILGAVGLPTALSSGAGMASALGLGAGLGSIIPGIGTVLGGLAAAFLPNLFRPNRPAIQDIAAALARGQQPTPQQWNIAGYGPGGTYLSAAQLLQRAPGQKNNAPLRDIAQALYAGRPVSDASWAMAGLPPGGGPYGQLLMSQIEAMRNAPAAARQQIGQIGPLSFNYPAIPMGA